MGGGLTRNKQGNEVLCGTLAIWDWVENLAMKAALPYKEWEEILWRRKLHLLGLGGIRRPEALLNEDAMWWYRNADNLTLVFPGGKSCALSQEKREECQSLVFREWDPEMLRFSDKMKDILTSWRLYLGARKVPPSLLPLDVGKGKGMRICL